MILVHFNFQTFRIILTSQDHSEQFVDMLLCEHLVTQELREFRATELIGRGARQSGIPEERSAVRSSEVDHGHHHAEAKFAMAYSKHSRRLRYISCKFS